MSEREDIYVNSEHETNRRFQWTAVGSRQPRVRFSVSEYIHAIGGAMQSTVNHATRCWSPCLFHARVIVTVGNMHKLRSVNAAPV